MVLADVQDLFLIQLALPGLATRVAKKIWNGSLFVLSMSVLIADPMAAVKTGNVTCICPSGQIGVYDHSQTFPSDLFT